ncbi:MAG: hypothetical protein II328_00395 [Clostridia bacterium]|nr:hypothetical protein [Clostridia bacterium]
MLRFQVNNQTLTLSEDSDRVLYSGAREFVRFRMDFGKEWDGYFVIARFFRTGQEAFELADVQSGEEYYVPYQVLEEPGSFYVSVFGVKGERSLATVGSLRLDVRESRAPAVSRPVGETEPTLLSEFVRLLRDTATELSLAPLAFRSTDTHLQYKYESEADSAWRDLVALEQIRGPKGEVGARGEKGEIGEVGARGADGFGLTMVENADLNDLTEPGFYLCLRGQKENVPDRFPSSSGDLIVWVFNEYNVSTNVDTVQVILHSPEGEGTLRLYSRRYDSAEAMAWGPWNEGLALANGSVSEAALAKSLYASPEKVNLLDIHSVSVEDGYYLAEDGQLVRSTAYSTSAYIPVEPGRYVYRRLTTGEAIFCGVLYDKKKRFVSFFGSDTPTAENIHVLDVENEGYVRVSYRAGSSDNFSRYHMFARGDESTPFCVFGGVGTLFPARAFSTGTAVFPDRDQAVFGHYNRFVSGGYKSGSGGSAFVIGNGTAEAQSNAFRVSYEGRTYAGAAYTTSGADYAELFEWADGNPKGEDRVGRLVTLCGDRIRLSKADDVPFGIVSAHPAVLGDAASENWCGQYQRDVFGRILTEKGASGEEVPLLSADFDVSRRYVPREERREWAKIGLVGKLVCRDDGTLRAGDLVKSAGEGVATKSEGYSPFYVMRRVDDDHVLIFVR